MVGQAGRLEGVDRIYGLHVSDELDAGTVGVCPGKYMAASDSFFITFTGNGGHGSRPDETPDTVLSAASAIIEINTIISRFVPPRSAAVVSRGTGTPVTYSRGERSKVKRAGVRPRSEARRGQRLQHPRRQGVQRPAQPGVH